MLYPRISAIFCRQQQSFVPMHYFAHSFKSFEYVSGETRTYTLSHQDRIIELLNRLNKCKNPFIIITQEPYYYKATLALMPQNPKTIPTIRTGHPRGSITFLTKVLVKAALFLSQKSAYYSGRYCIFSVGSAQSGHPNAICLLYID